MILILKHIDIEGPGTIAAYFQRQGAPVKIVELSQNEALPKQLNGIDGVIILGGPMNVYEEDTYPYLAQEHQFILQVLREEIPLLGICLGSQLLAKACGAKVLKAKIKEIGWRIIEQTDEGSQDPLFNGLGKQLIVFQWHEDTFHLPKDASLLSTSTVVPHQAFKIEPNAYGLQYHLEVTEEIIESWIKEYFKIDDIKRSPEGKQIMEQYKQLKKQFHAQAETVYTNFEQIIQHSKAKRITK